MKGQHHYKIDVQWTGNTGTGTLHCRSYERSHIISTGYKAAILGSSDPSFPGDKTKHNPEDLLLASISACHLLWYLHVCSDAGVVVIDYIDHAEGTIVENPDGSGHFTEVTLHPIVTAADCEMVEKELNLHKKANEMC